MRRGIKNLRHQLLKYCGVGWRQNWWQRRWCSQASGILENLNEGFFAVSADWTITRVNRCHEEYTSLRRDQQIGKNFLDLFFPTEALRHSRYWREYHRAMEQRVTVSFEDFYEPLKIWTRVNAYPQTDGGLAVFFRDTTHEKQSERTAKTNLANLKESERALRLAHDELKNANQRLQSVMNTMPLFAGLASPDGSTLLINDAAVGIMAHSREECMQLKCWELSTWSEMPHRGSLIRDAVSKAVQGQAQRFDTQYMSTIDGKKEVRWVDLLIMPLFDDDGKVVSLVKTGFDITDRLQKEKDLAETRMIAERANSTKSAFLANMSHEIRTPLGAILGYGELLREIDLTADEHGLYVETIVRNARSLTRIIDDILDLAKVEAGKMDIETINFSLAELMQEVISLFSENAKRKGIFLVLHVEDNVPHHLSSDPTRLRQILTNLIGNAVKFTTTGGVWVHVLAKSDMQGKIQLEVYVKDSGIGVSAEQRVHLFEPFTQADNSISRKFGGTGLGLALSRRLAKALGGDVFIDDGHEGVGCTFVLHFIASPADQELESIEEPLIPVLRSPSSALASTALSGVRVLLAEDAQDNQFLVSRILAQCGAVVDVASDGEEAIRKATTRPFDIVLMDIQMPRVDGIEATKALRSLNYQTPIIALTAHAMIEERERTKTAGCNAHLTKPLNAKQLLDTVVHFTQRV